MENVFSNNQIVRLRNGKFGCVDSFNNKPHLLVFYSFTSVLTRYNGYKHKTKSDYDIVEVYDGSSIENVTNIWKKSFAPEGLPLIWKEETEQTNEVE